MTPKKFSNTESVVINLLNFLGYKFAPNDIVNELGKHPDFPGLLSISDILNNFKVRNEAYIIPVDQLENVPCPFIANTEITGGAFVVVNEIKGDHFIITSDIFYKKKVPADQFHQTFTGLVLQAEPAPKAFFQKPSALLLRRLSIAGLSCILFWLIGFNSPYFTTANAMLISATFIKIIGLAATVMLLVQSIDNNNVFIQVICQLSTKGGCNSILSSPAANVFSWLTWSEVGFFYFSGTLLVMLFAGNSVKTVSVLFLFNIICLPYTVYSVCYQAFIARQWCVLCCSVQASLWLEFACLARYVSINGFQLSSFTVNEAGTLICCLAGPVFSWIVMKPYFIKLQLQPSLQRQLNKLKYDVISFGNLLKTQPQYPVPNKNWSILLGSEDAASVITVVINPYCTPCAKTHVALTELLEKNKSLQARIIFRDPNSEDDRRTIISRHLMALNEAGDKALMERALNDWFAQKTKKYEKWAQKYPVNLIEDNFSKLDIQNAWCKQAKIGSTPAVLLNGYHLPEIYQLKDLKYMIEDTEDTLQG